jgi:hypothetical protein
MRMWSKEEGRERETAASKQKNKDKSAKEGKQNTKAQNQTKQNKRENRTKHLFLYDSPSSQALPQKGRAFFMYTPRGGEKKI